MKSKFMNFLRKNKCQYRFFKYAIIRNGKETVKSILKEENAESYFYQAFIWGNVNNISKDFYDTIEHRFWADLDIQWGDELNKLE